MGAITQGLMAGLAIRQRREEAAQLQALHDRQMMLGSFQTLSQIMGMDKNLRGPMLEQFSDVMQRTTGKPISPTLIEVFKKADEEQAQNLRSMFSSMGLKMSPDQALAIMGDPFKALQLAAGWQKGQDEEQRRSLRASIAGGEDPTQRPLPAMPDVQLRTGPQGVALGMPAEAPAPPAPTPTPTPPPVAAAAPAAEGVAPADEDAALARLDTLEENTLARMDKLMALGEGLSEAEGRGFNAKLKALSDRRAAILNAPGITETVAGPDGTPLRVLYTKSGHVKSILGKVPPTLEIREGANPANGQPAILAFDKATGTATVIGRPAPPVQAPLQIDRLIARRNQYPPGSPNRKIYDDLIAKETGAGAGGEKASQLATQFAAQSRQFQEVSDHYSNMISAVPPGTRPTPASSVTILYGWFKMMNPTSRMSLDTFSDIGSVESIPDQIKSQWKKAVQGGVLDEKFRQDILQQGRRLYEGQARQHQARVKHFTQAAEASGVDPRLVIAPFGVVPPAGGGAPTETGGGAEPDAESKKARAAARKRLRLD